MSRDLLSIVLGWREVCFCCWRCWQRFCHRNFVLATIERVKVKWPATPPGMVTASLPESLSRENGVKITWRQQSAAQIQGGKYHKKFQKCVTYAQLKLFSVTHKIGYVCSVIILKRKVCNQAMSSCCGHKIIEACCLRETSACSQSVVSNK